MILINQQWEISKDNRIRSIKQYGNQTNQTAQNKSLRSKPGYRRSKILSNSQQLLFLLDTVAKIKSHLLVRTIMKTRNPNKPHIILRVRSKWILLSYLLWLFRVELWKFKRSLVINYPQGLQIAWKMKRTLKWLKSRKKRSDFSI